MVRYIAVWVFISVAVYAFRYIMNTDEKRAFRGFGRQAFVSCSISAVVIVVLYFLNNVQGL